MITVDELLQRKRHGDFGAVEWLYVWGMSTRWFALLWTFLSGLFGVLLAGTFIKIDWYYAFCAFGVTQSLLLASHFMNNFRDYERGVDDANDPSEVKDYTGASALVPLGITSVRFQKVNTIVFALLSAVFLWPLLSLPWLPQILFIYFWGVFIAFAYTDLFKPNGMGELGIFLGQCLAVSVATFISQTPLTTGNWWQIIFAMVPISFAGAFFYSIDQYQDAESDMTKRVRNWAILLWRSRLPLGLYILMGYTFVLFVQHVAITIGILPIISLVLTAPTWIIIMGIAAYVHVDREKALKLAVFAFIYLYPALMCLSLVIT